LLETFEAELQHQRVCGAVARRLVEERYGDQLDGGTLDDLKLVVSELVYNAYLHGEGRIRLRLQARHEHVRVEVMDEGRNASIKIRRIGARGGGSGLRLIDHLCSRWGAFEGGTHVWAELPVGQNRRG
jgi:anti-sigma regulatory factor (Ser/Thr protein kinase)